MQTDLLTRMPTKNIYKLLPERHSPPTPPTPSSHAISHKKPYNYSNINYMLFCAVNYIVTLDPHFYLLSSHKSAIYPRKCALIQSILSPFLAKFRRLHTRLAYSLSSPNQDQYNPCHRVNLRVQSIVRRKEYTYKPSVEKPTGIPAFADVHSYLISVLWLYQRC